MKTFSRSTIILIKTSINSPSKPCLQHLIRRTLFHRDLQPFLNNQIDAHLAFVTFEDLTLIRRLPHPPSLAILALISLTLANPIPDTDTSATTDMTATNATENALFGDWYIWCGNVKRTIDCTSPPGNYECLSTGAPDGNRKITACRDNCRCLPECSYIVSLYQVPCGVSVSAKDWLKELSGQ